MIDPVRRIPDIINEVVSGQKYNAETFMQKYNAETHLYHYASYKMHDKR